MKLESFIYEIRALLPSDWLDVDDRHIIKWINEQRALWLKNEFNNGRLVDDRLKQSIPIEVKLVNSSEVSGVKANSVLLKTIYEIPNVIIKHYSDTITSVHSVSILDEKFNYVLKDDAIYSGNGKINSRDIFCFKYNKYLYIKCQKSNPKIKIIKDIVIEGVFEDPIEVERDYINRGKDIDIMKIEYPISDAIWVYMKGQILKNGLILKESEDVEKREGN